MNFRMTSTPTVEEKDTIYQQLLDYNLARLENTNVEELALFLEDEAGQKTAGLIGETHGNWLEIDYLWVSETLRGQDIGTALIKEAENVARKRGCLSAFLFTFDFQAPGFYEKLGYEEKFVLADFPVSGKKHFYTKKL